MWLPPLIRRGGAATAARSVIAPTLSVMPVLDDAVSAGGHGQERQPPPWRALAAASLLHAAILGCFALSALSCTGWRTLMLYTPWPDALGPDACQRAGVAGSKPIEAVFVRMPVSAKSPPRPPTSPRNAAPAARPGGVEKATILHSTTRSAVSGADIDRGSRSADAHSAPAAGDAPDSGPDVRGHSTAIAYQVAVVRAILQHWNRPAGMAPGSHCQISIRQERGGQVDSVTPLPGCTFDLAGWRAIEAAVAQASPLPYSGFESAFHRVITVRFALKAK